MRKSFMSIFVAATVLLGPAATAQAAQAPTGGTAGTVWTDAPGEQGIANYQERKKLAASKSSVNRTNVADAESIAAAGGLPPWGSCGFGVKADKIIKLFPTKANRQRDWVLRCGDKSFGFFHIKDRHMKDFQNLAAFTGDTWMDVADLGMSSSLSDPDVIKPAGGNQTCRSRVIFLVDKRTGKTVKQATVRMFTDNANWNIRTIFPGPHCV